MESEILLTVKLDERLFVDPKRVRLLQAIQSCGSINQAAKMTNVSYKSAWDHLEAMDKISPQPLLERNIGGKNGGGTALTAYAKRLLQLYDLLEKTQKKAFEILQNEQIPLHSILNATAQFSLKSSARNQFLGKVKAIVCQHLQCQIQVEITEIPILLTACITSQSAKQLSLAVGKEVILMAKAPWVMLYSEPTAVKNLVEAEVEQWVEKGNVGEVTLKITENLRCYATTSNVDVTVGQRIWFSIAPENFIVVTL